LNFFPDQTDENSAEKQILTVRQLNESISDAMRRSFPGTVWVKGEVQRLPADAARRTHIYFELHETGQSGAAEYQIPVSLMGWDRNRFGLGRYLDGTDPDFQLANKLEVCLECQVDYYAKFGKLSLKIVGVDKNFALGKLEAQRRATLEYLKAENLLHKNSGLSLPSLPLRVGLITSPGSAAERDFITGLETSPFAFQVILRGAKMQGQQLQGEVIKALSGLDQARVDVIVITRGGGSRADLSWFDQKELAKAIATCQVPVITAIGHEIDRSIADLVAHHSCKTPTAAAEFLVERLQEAATLVESAAQRLKLATSQALADAARRIDLESSLVRAADSALLQAKVRFQKLANRFQSHLGNQLRQRQQKLARLETTLITRVSRQTVAAGSRMEKCQLRLTSRSDSVLQAASRRLDDNRRQIRREALRPLGDLARKLDHFTVQARLLDPARLLARGYTLTSTADGRVIKSAESISIGDRLRTRFADGQVDSIVQPGGDIATKSPTPNKSGKAKPDDGKKKKTNPGQKTLFQ